MNDNEEKSEDVKSSHTLDKESCQSVPNKLLGDQSFQTSMMCGMSMIGTEKYVLLWSDTVRASEKTCIDEVSVRLNLKMRHLSHVSETFPTHPNKLLFIMNQESEN